MRIRPASIGAAFAVVALLAWLATQDPGDRDPDAASPPTSHPGPATDAGHSEESTGASSIPCAVPMAWRIARVDPGFGLSHEEARAALEEAAAHWADAVGRPLFTYDPEEGFPVRFVFDERQIRTQERIRRERELEEIRERRDRDRLREELARAFPPRPVEAGLHREAVVTDGGRVVSVGREIRVFQFENRAALVRVLAHELGHAMGLGHAPGPGAMMSEEYTRESIHSDGGPIGPADVALLRDRCPRLWESG
jgi:hypothetical protein